MLTKVVVGYCIVTALEIIIPFVFFFYKNRHGRFDGGTKYTYEDEVLELPEDMRQ